jgi:mRNA interferase HigB
MKIHLVKKQTIETFVRYHPGIRNSVRYWQLVVKGADWGSPGDIVNTFGSADLLGNGCDRVVFDIGGNNYRMICHYVFGEKEVHLFICWMGSHADYTKLCRENKQYTVSDY